MLEKSDFKQDERLAKREEKWLIGEIILDYKSLFRRKRVYVQSTSYP
jgi:hypothetical protein